LVTIDVAGCLKDIVEQLGVTPWMLKKGKVRGSIKSKRFGAAPQKKHLERVLLASIGESDAMAQLQSSRSIVTGHKRL